MALVRGLLNCRRTCIEDHTLLQNAVLYAFNDPDFVEDRLFSKVSCQLLNVCVFFKASKLYVFGDLINSRLVAFDALIIFE